MMKKLKMWMLSAILLCGTAVMFTSCTANDNNDNPVGPEITLEDALKDGTIVAFTFNLNGEDFYVAFLRVGDTYELLDYDKMAPRRSAEPAEPAIKAEDCTFAMEHDKANDLLKFFVNEKKTSKLIFTATFDIKQSTVDVVPGDSDIKVTGFKMKVSNVEITKLLKDVSDGVTLADALVKGAKVVITYKWYDKSTTFTFTNNGGTFSCQLSGTTEYIDGKLTSEGSTLFFSTTDWTNDEYTLEIKFNVANNTFKFWTIRHEVYKSHTISVNGVDITNKLTEERL